MIRAISRTVSFAKPLRFNLVILILAVSLALGTLSFAAPTDAPDNLSGIELPEVVAKVNGVDIESKFVLLEFFRALRRINQPLKVSQKKTLLRDIIDKEIVRELVYQQGKKKNLTVEPEVVNKEMEGLRSAYANVADFKKALKKREISEGDLEESMRIDIMARKLLDEEIRGKIQIRDADVKKYYEENKQQFFRPVAYRVRHIFVAIYPPELVKNKSVEELRPQQEELKKTARARIEEALKEVQHGENFAELVKKYSHDAGSREVGGDLGFIYQGVFDPVIDEAALKLNPGEVSGIVDTEYGHHILKMVETQPPGQAPFDEVEEGIQKHLFMEASREKVQAYIDELRASAEIKTFF